MKAQTHFFLFLVILLVIPLSNYSQQDTKSLHQHLLEVNKEWATQKTAGIDLKQSISFTSEAERIQTHLLYVIQTLRNRNVLHLSPIQQDTRKNLLNALEQYAQEAIFPINTQHDARIPYFIDDFGTACAVGHMIIESGHRDLALKVQEEQNNAYIREMQFPELLAWANQHGFSTDELAWVQPGYPPPILPTKLGQGTDGSINVLLNDDTRMILAGSFQTADGVACSNVAVWENGMFSPLGNGVIGAVQTGILFDDDIYLAGTFLGPQGQPYNLAQWDGTEWTYQSVLLGEINVLHIHDGQLVAGGSLHTGGAPGYSLVSSADGKTWTAVDQGFNAPIHALTSFDGSLIVGGEFTSIGAMQASFVASWDGFNWNAMNGGLDNMVYALAANDTAIYVGGAFQNDAEEFTFGLAKYQDNTWANLIDTEHFIGDWPIPKPFFVKKILIEENGIYVAGRFNIQPLVGTYGSGLGLLTSWGLEALVDVDSTISDVVRWDGRLYAAGDFTHANFTAGYNHILRIGFATDLDENLNKNQLNIYPNPVSDKGIIQISSKNYNLYTNLFVYSVNGQKVPVSYQWQGDDKIELNTATLQKGMYFFQLQSNEGLLGKGQFIVE